LVAARLVRLEGHADRFASGRASPSEVAWSASEPSAAALNQKMLQGRYRRRRKTIGQRLQRVGLSGWLWVLAAVVAAIVIGLYLA
jgi:hypothetical protein